MNQLQTKGFRTSALVRGHYSVQRWSFGLARRIEASKNNDGSLGDLHESLRLQRGSMELPEGGKPSEVNDGTTRWEVPILRA